MHNTHSLIALRPCQYQAKHSTSSACSPPQISEEDLEQALQSAIKCAVLAAAGPQRSRMLATLYKASMGCLAFD